MPLSEFYKMSRGSLESIQQRTTTSSADLYHLPGNEFVELVWENGQIVMQGQTTRPRKTSTSSIFQSQIQKMREKDLRNATNSKMGKFGVMDCVLNDFATPVLPGEMGLDRDDDMLPWLNYHVDDSLPQDYCSELLPELSNVTVSQLSSQSTFATNNKRSSYNQTHRGSNYVQNGLGLEQAIVAKVSSSEVGEGSGSRSGQFFPWSFQASQTSIPSLISDVSSIISNCKTDTKHAVCGDPSTGVKIQEPDSVLPNTNSGIMNFSHFSRPAALVHADLQNINVIATSGILGIEGIGGKNKGPAPSNTILSESTLNLSSGLSKEMDSNSQLNSLAPKVNSTVVAKSIEELCAAEQSEAVCREYAIKNDKLLNEVGGEKTVEQVAASSSLCSGNSAERASNDLTDNLNRKSRGIDDSEGRSEDAEEESVGIRKAAPVRRCPGSKRSRAAEVHNLSERRRRDRINEKMRALQELIPNCNKVDKASMLDDAIEYLKTLQLQVQIMSMGCGMYMPPMMLPTGMTHLHAAHMAHFSPTGMGFGLGMIDMNGGSPGCPMIQVPPMIQLPPFHGVHFPEPRPAPFFGPTSFQGMTGPNLQVWGHPSKCVLFEGGAPMNSAMDLNASPVEVPNSAPSSNPEDLMQNANSQKMDNANANSSMNHTSSQCQVPNACFGQSSSVH